MPPSALRDFFTLVVLKPRLRLPHHRVALRRRLRVLDPNLHRLVALRRDQPALTHVERAPEDAVLALERALLHRALQRLELVPAVPVPEVQLAVVRPRHQHRRLAVVLYGGAVQNRVVAAQVPVEDALGALPDLHVVRPRAAEGVLRRVDRQRAHALLVVGQRRQRPAGGQVPQPHRLVLRAGDHLRLRPLRRQAHDGARVAREHVHGLLGADVPHPHHGVAAAAEEHVQPRVQRQRVDPREVPVVAPDHLVLLNVPALDRVVLAAAEEVGVAVRDLEVPHRVDVPRQRQLQLAGGEVPDLDQAVRAARGEPLVGHVDRHAVHPPLVADDHAVELPRRVPLGLAAAQRARLGLDAQGCDSVAPRDRFPEVGAHRGGSRIRSVHHDAHGATIVPLRRPAVSQRQQRPLAHDAQVHLVSHRCVEVRQLAARRAGAGQGRVKSVHHLGDRRLGLAHLDCRRLLLRRNVTGSAATRSSALDRPRRRLGLVVQHRAVLRQDRAREPPPGRLVPGTERVRRELPREHVQRLVQLPSPCRSKKRTEGRSVHRFQRVRTITFLKPRTITGSPSTTEGAGSIYRLTGTRAAAESTVHIGRGEDILRDATRTRRDADEPIHAANSVDYAEAATLRATVMASQNEGAHSDSSTGPRRQGAGDEAMEREEAPPRAAAHAEAVSRGLCTPDLDHKAWELLAETDRCAPGELVSRVNGGFQTIKGIFTSQTADDGLRTKALECLERVVSWEAPNDWMAVGFRVGFAPHHAQREILDLCFHTVVTRSDRRQLAVCRRVLCGLLRVPRPCPALSSFDAMLELFVKLLDGGDVGSDDKAARMSVLSATFDILFKQTSHEKYFTRLLPKLEKYFADGRIENDEFHRAVIKVTCQILKMCAYMAETTVRDLNTFTRNVFDAIVQLLHSAESYDHRAALMACMALLAGSGLNKLLLAEITAGDLLFRVNEGWQHEAMVGICIISVFVESLQHLRDEDFTAVADNCLRLYNVYSSTDDYHMRERLIMLLYAFTRKLKGVYDDISGGELPMFQEIVAVLFNKATHEIQLLNAPKVMWSDGAFVTFARATMPVLIKMAANCISAIAVPDSAERPKEPTPNNTPVEDGAVREEPHASEKSTTVVKVEGEKLALAAAGDEEFPQLPPTKRPLTQVECLEICKSMCCIFDAGATASTVLSDWGKAGVANDELLQLREIKGFITMSLRMFVGAFRPTALKQWIKLMIPVAFVMSLRDRFVLAVFDCFRKGYAETFAPHMLTFLLQVLKNQQNALDYVRKVAAYSEGVIGLFSLSDWEPCSQRLARQDSAAIIDLAQAVARHMFIAFSEVPEALTACHTEIMHLTTAVSKLSVTETDPHLPVATAMFKGINKLQEYAAALLILRKPIDIIVRKVVKGGSNVHRDWLKLMMATVARGPFTPEVVHMCALPALCILRDFKWDLVPAALEMLESWTEYLPPDEFYDLLSRVRLYAASTVRPHFIECLTKYLQDESLPCFRQNAASIMHIFTKMGSHSTNYQRDMPIKQDIPHAIALPLALTHEALEHESRSDSTKLQPSPSMGSSFSTVLSLDTAGSAQERGSTGAESEHPTDELMSLGELNVDKGDLDGAMGAPDVVGIGIPVIEGLNSVIRQMSKSDLSRTDLEGSAVFVLNAVSPVLDFSVSLSECYLALMNLPPDHPSRSNTKYHTQETTREFVFTLMHALIKVTAVVRREHPASQACRDLDLLLGALERYLVVVCETQAQSAIEVAVDPVLVLQGVADRLLVSRERPEFNFGLPSDHVDPLEADVAVEFFSAVFTEAAAIGCHQLCGTIVTMLCLGCNSHDRRQKLGACRALGKICGDHPRFVQPVVLDVANSVAQLCDGKADDFKTMTTTLEALIRADEATVVQWAASLLEHPFWYLRAVGQICLRAATSKADVEAQLQKLKAVARDLQTPDVQIFLATMENGDLSLLDRAVSNIQPYMQAISECSDANEMFRAEADAYIDLLGQLVTEAEYARAAEEMEESLNLVLVWFLKLLIIGAPETAQRARRILDNAKNASVGSKTLFTALEEYIFQLQTIFDEGLLERILEVVRRYKDVVDDALIESLFNVAKALIEGTLNSSINDEYQNAHFIDYMVFIASMGAGRSCADVIFGQWFTTIDCLRKGVIIPGSVAYGIWQVLSYDGDIYHVFNNAMAMEHFNFLYFASGKADVDYILSNAVASLGSGSDLPNLFYASLVHRLCKDDVKQVTDSKHFKRLVEAMFQVSCGIDTQIDDFLTPPFELDKGKMLRWKVAYVCAAVLLKVAPMSSLQARVTDKASLNYEQEELSGFDRFITAGFLDHYNTKKTGCVFNPIVGGQILNMRNYQLLHLLSMLHRGLRDQMRGVIEEFVDFCWQSSAEGDALGKLLAIACLAKLVEVNNTPLVGAVAVLRNFVEVLAMSDVHVFLNMHHTVRLDYLATGGRRDGTLSEILRKCAGLLVKALCGVHVPADFGKGLKESTMPSTPKMPLWKWILLSKVRELVDEPKRMVPLMACFVLHLHDDLTMFGDSLLEMVRAIPAQVGTGSCNLMQGGIFDAFFGALAVMYKNGLEMDLNWAQESCKDMISACFQSDVRIGDIAQYTDLLVNLFVRAPRFDLLSHQIRTLYHMPLRDSKDHLFNQTHLSDNASFSLTCDDPNERRLRGSLPPHPASSPKKADKNADSKRQRFRKGAILILDMLDRVLDHVVPKADDVFHITEILDCVWYLNNPRVSELLQSCIFKVCCLFKDQFSETRPQPSAVDTKLDQDVDMDAAEADKTGSEPRTERDEGAHTAAEKRDDVGSVTAYVKHFPKWLIGKVVTETRGAKKDPMEHVEPEEEDRLHHVVCHYLETSTIHYVNSPRSASMSGRDTPSNPLAALSRMVSTNPHETWPEERTVPEGDVGSSFSNAVRSLFALIEAIGTDSVLLQQVLQDTLPEFVDLLHHAVSKVEDPDDFATGRLRIYSSFFFIPYDAQPPTESEEYDEEGSRNLEQLLGLTMWALPMFDAAVRHKLYEIMAVFTRSLTHPYNPTLLRVATEMAAVVGTNAMELDEAFADETPTTSKNAKGCKGRLAGRAKKDTKAKAASAAESTSTQTPQKVTKEPVKRAKKNRRAGNGTSDEADLGVAEDHGTLGGTVTFALFTTSAKDSLKMAELKSCFKGISQTYPRQLLDNGERAEAKVAFEALAPVPKDKEPPRVELDAVLQLLKLIYADSPEKEALDLEFVHAIRNLAYHDTIYDAYYELVINCIDRPSCENLPIKTQMIAYLACLSKRCETFMDAFEEIDIPSDLFSVVRHLLTSEIGCNRDKGFYIPLFLDLIFTLAVESWGLSFSDDYPALPSLVHRDRAQTQQIDLICREDLKHTIKPGLLVLRDFRSMDPAAATHKAAPETEMPTFELGKRDPAPVSALLQKIHQYYTAYIGTIGTTANFKNCLRQMWHSDWEFASQVWAAIFPQLYDTFTTFQQDEMGNAVCRFLCREEHLFSRSLTCKAVVQGAIRCYPPVNMPPEVLKYVAVSLGSWHEVLYQLEKQLLSQPLDITRMATVLSDLYERLNMDDMAIGAYRTWVITQETRLAICFLQHAKWKQAQREFDSIMSALALTGQTAEAVSSFDESKIWYNGWVQASKQLGEWDLLRDVSFVAGDHKLFMQASNALQDWEEVLPEDGLQNMSRIFALDDAECTINKVYQQLQTAILPLREPDNEITPSFMVKCARKAEKTVKLGKDAILNSWLLLPRGLSEAHRMPLRLHQRFVEVEEGMKYLTDVMRSVHRGKMPESAPLISKWRKRLPTQSDMPSIWHDMLSWRTFLFSTVRSMVANSHTVPKDSKLTGILNLQDLQWTLTKFASVTRKAHQLPLVAAVILNKAHKFHKSILDQSNLVTEDCLVIMIERIKQYLSIPVNVLDMLKGVVTMDLDFIPGSGCEALKSHVIRLMADAVNRKSAFEMPKRTATAENEMACKLMLDAIKLEPMIAKNWVAWAKYNDKRIDHAGIAQWRATDGNAALPLYEAAIIGYLTAVSIRPQSHWLLIGRVLTLLHELKTIPQSASCAETFKRYSERVPVSVWLLWLPQLISGLTRLDGGEMLHVLQLLMNKLPQQVFYALRCEYFAQNSAAESEPGSADATQPATMKRLLSTLIASNPNVGTMLESFAATVTHLGRPDFVDEILCATETVFEECLDLPFNESPPPHMFNCLTMKMPHRSPLMSEAGDSESPVAQLLKQYDRELTEASTTLKCGEMMNLLFNWMARLNQASRSSHAEVLRQRMTSMKIHQFCQHLQMLNMDLQLPTLQPSMSLLHPTQRHCLGDSTRVVAILPEVKKRKRGLHIVKSISILAQNGQVYTYTVQPLALMRQKSEQHVSQMLKVFNHFAAKYNETRRRDLVLPTVSVVPLDPYLCLYEDDVNDETLSQIFSGAVSYRNLVTQRPRDRSLVHAHPAMSHETNMLLLVLHKMMMERGVTQQLLQRWQKFNPDCTEELTFTRVYQLFKDKQYPWFTAWYKKIHQDVLMEAYSEICALIPDDILVRYAMRRFASYQDFMTLKQRFTSNYAIQALLGLMLVTPYATPCKLSVNFNTGQVKQLDLRLNYSREIYVEFSKLRVFRFTRNIKTMIGPVCRMGIMPAVMYAMCSAIHTYKIDILGALGAILSDDFSLVQPAPSASGDKPEAAAGAGTGSQPSTPLMVPNRDHSLLDEYVSRVLNYCSYLRSPTDQEHFTMPINNVISCIIDASADSGTLGKLKTSYQPDGRVGREGHHAPRRPADGRQPVGPQRRQQLDQREVDHALVLVELARGRGGGAPRLRVAAVQVAVHHQVVAVGVVGEMVAAHDLAEAPARPAAHDARRVEAEELVVGHEGAVELLGHRVLHPRGGREDHEEVAHDAGRHLHADRDQRRRVHLHVQRPADVHALAVEARRARGHVARVGQRHNRAGALGVDDDPEVAAVARAERGGDQHVLPRVEVEVGRAAVDLVLVRGHRVAHLQRAEGRQAPLEDAQVHGDGAAALQQHHRLPRLGEVQPVVRVEEVAPQVVGAAAAVLLGPLAVHHRLLPVRLHQAGPRRQPDRPRAQRADGKGRVHLHLLVVVRQEHQQGVVPPVVVGHHRLARQHVLGGRLPARLVLHEELHQDALAVVVDALHVRQRGADDGVVAREHVHRQVLERVLPVLPVLQQQQPHDRRILAAEVNCQGELRVEDRHVHVLRNQRVAEALVVPPDVVHGDAVAEDARLPRDVQVGEPAQDVAPLDPELPRVAVAVGDVPQRLLQLRRPGLGVTRRKAPNPRDAAPGVFQVQQPRSVLSAQQHVLYVQHAVRVVADDARRPGNALGVSVAVGHGVRDLARPQAHDARAAAEPGVHHVPNLLPFNLGTAARAGTVRRRAGTGQVVNVDARVGAPDGVAAAVELHERLLEDRHPALVGVVRVRAQHAPVSPHGDPVVDQNAPRATVEIQLHSDGALALPGLRARLFGGLRREHAGISVLAHRHEVDDVRQQRHAVPVLVVRQSRQGSQERAVGHEPLPDAAAAGHRVEQLYLVIILEQPDPVAQARVLLRRQLRPPLGVLPRRHRRVPLVQVHQLPRRRHKVAQHGARPHNRVHRLAD
ncbi:non-specific serine/threonine protein kinase [Babesia caballi]|uniref:Non-specific serine/threonine protein kinase n=1 Tax=Babesia caballi TaxID=5871 RepID=A0AAV4LR48_BABCB|nr:non-specific serine/threonine protein kinase [Babesia caballi]